MEEMREKSVSEVAGLEEIREKSVSEVARWICSLFGETVAKAFEEQKIDGKGVILLATKGSQEQLQACGLPLVGEQLKLKEEVQQLEETSPPKTKSSKGKPSGKHVSSALHKRVYNAKKKAVRAAAIKKWPGNNIPNFKKNPESLQELNKLAMELETDCAYLAVGFNQNGIRQHIIDVLNERRRNVRKGYDYNACKIASTPKDVESATSMNADADAVSPPEMNQETEGLSIGAAHVIVATAMKEMRATDVSRSQLHSAAKTLKIKDLKSSTSRSRESLMLKVAEALVAQDYVRVPSTSIICREDVKILKPF